MKKFLTLLFIFCLTAGAWGQSYNTGYPKVIDITETTATVATNLTLASYYTNFVILEETFSPAPTLQQVIDWAYDGNSGTLPVNTYGEIAVVGRGAANTDKYFYASNLIAGTNYILYCVTTDATYTVESAIETTNPSTYSFTTSSPPPAWNTSIYKKTLTKDQLTAAGTLDKDGTYFTVITSSIDKPTDTQIEAQQDEFGNPALLNSTGAVVADNEFSSNIDITSLNSETQYYLHAVVKDASLNYSTVKSFGFTTLATTWSTSYPNLQNQSKTNIDVFGKVNDNGSYYIVLTQSNVTPSALQVEAGTDENDAAALVVASGVDAVIANTEFNTGLNISTLTSETNYWIYIVVKDESNNYTEVRQSPFTMQDTVEPTYNTTPTISDITGTSANINVEINEDGLFYWVVLPATETAPSANQVINGTDSNDNPATHKGQSGLTANTNAQAPVNSMTSETDYIAYVVTRDDNFNYISSPNPQTIAFTTADVTAPVSTFDPLSASTDIAIDKTITISFNEAIYNDLGVLIDNGNVASIVSLKENSEVGPDVPSTITYDGVNYIITIDPTSDLSQNQLYNIHLDAIQDASANATSAINATFTTVSPPETSFSPTDGATQVSITTDIKVSYNQAVRNTNATEITDANVASLITLLYDATPIPFTATINTGKTLITITPDADLPADKTINVTIAPVENNAGTEQLVDQTCNFTTDIYYTWTGSASSSFTDPANWGGSYSNGYSVIIPKTATSPSITTTPNLANNVIIEAGASLTIESGASLTVSKTLRLKSSVVESVGNANLLNNGTLTTTGATVIAEQYNDPIGIYTSSPVTGATKTSAGITGSLKYRDASTATWVALGDAETITPGLGLLAYGNSGEIIEFTGPFNNGASYLTNTVRTTTPNNFGWNLIGNPYPCSIDWESVTLSNMDDEFYILNNDTEIYGTYNGNGTPTYTNVNQSNPSHIPSCHAFWAQVTLGQTDGSITIPSSARVNTHYTYLKNATISTRENIRFAGINSENVKDEMLVSFTNEALDSEDPYDSEKRFTWNTTVLQPYTIHSSNNFTIDTYSGYEGGRSIQMGYKTGVAGTYKLALTELTNIEDKATIQLEDKLLRTITPMTVNDEYSFTTESGTFENRFVIHVIPNVTTDINSDSTTDIEIYSADNNIYVNIPQLTKPYYQIYSTNGKLLESGILETESLNRIETNFGDGIVLMKVISNEKTITKKVYIKK